MYIFIIILLLLIPACSPAPVEQPDYNQEITDKPIIETISKSATSEANPEIMTYESEDQIQTNFEDDVKVAGIIQDEIPLAILEIYGQSCVGGVGDKVIGGFVVERIGTNEVELKWGEKRFVVKLNNQTLACSVERPGQAIDQSTIVD